MGPERVCPREPGPPDGPDGAAGWSGDEEEEEEEEEESGGYLYQPLSQEPEQGPGDAGPGLQERLQVPPSAARRAGVVGHPRCRPPLPAFLRRC